MQAFEDGTVRIKSFWPGWPGGLEPPKVQRPLDHQPLKRRWFFFLPIKAEIPWFHGLREADC